MTLAKAYEVVVLDRITRVERTFVHVLLVVAIIDMWFAERSRGNRCAAWIRSAS